MSILVSTCMHFTYREKVVAVFRVRFRLLDVDSRPYPLRLYIPYTYLSPAPTYIPVWSSVPVQVHSTYTLSRLLSV
jgi:hypothetical protein